MNNEKPKINIISAIGTDGIIGVAGKLPWYIPQELKFFKAKTMGHVLIMGRKTAMEFPDGLVGRHIIAIGDSTKVEPNKLIWAITIQEAVDKAFHLSPYKDIFVAGGASIYGAFLDADLVDELHLSYVMPSYMKEIGTEDIVKFPIDKIRGDVVEESFHEGFSFKLRKVR